MTVWLILGGFLVGGVIAFGQQKRWIPTGVCAVLAVMSLLVALTKA